MGLLDIKTNLSEAFRKTGYSKSEPFESKSPPKQGEYPQLLPNDVNKDFNIGNPVSSPEISIGKARGSLKISDFSQGDIFHTQPYVNTPIRAEVRFPLTQIVNHKVRVGKFLDSDEGILFIGKQSNLQQFNAMPESFDGSSASGGKYKVFKSDNTVFSPLGIRGSSTPGFHIERHKIDRTSSRDAFGRFVSDEDGSRSNYITQNFPNLVATRDRINIQQEGQAVKSAFDRSLETVGTGFSKRFEPQLENMMASVVEQAFTNPRKITIKKVASDFKSLASSSLAGALGDLLGSTSKTLVSRGQSGNGNYFSGVSSKINFNLGDSRLGRVGSAILNTGSKIVVDSISNVAQQKFAEVVTQQTLKAGTWVGKRLGVDPRFVTNAIQSAFNEKAVVLSQISAPSNLNKYNVYAPYGYPSRHDDDGDKSRVWVQDRPDFGKVAGYGYKERTGNNVAVDFGVKHSFPFVHVSRAFFTDDTDYKPNMLQANPDGLYPFKNILGTQPYNQIYYETLPYSKLVSNEKGLGNYHPAKLAGYESVTDYLQQEKVISLPDYGSAPAGMNGYAENGELGLIKDAKKSDLVTLKSPTLGEKVDSVADDFITFSFYDVVNKRNIQFRAILGAITDTVRPEYEPIRYLGRPDQVYIYKGAVRNINFTFKYAAQTKQELIYGWEKLNYLVGLAYPAKYQEGGIGGGQMVTPLVRLTIGKMFEAAPGLMNNISLTVTDQSPWDINPNLQLPKYVEAAIDFQYIGEYPLRMVGKHYGLRYLKDDGDDVVDNKDILNLRANSDSAVNSKLGDTSGLNFSSPKQNQSKFAPKASDIVKSVKSALNLAR